MGENDFDKDLDKELDKIESNDSDDEKLSLPSRPPRATVRDPQIPMSATVYTNGDERGIAPDDDNRLSSSGSSVHSHDTAPDDDFPIPTDRVRSQGQSSGRSVQREAVIVPRPQRRGLLARCAVIAEVTNAQDYTRKKKWTITIIVAVAGAAAPMGSSIILPALVDIAKGLHSTPTIVNLSVAMYMLAMSIFPLWWSSFSETLGRRSILLVSFTMSCVFNVCAALSVNISMFIIMRMLAGGAAASVQAVGAGTIADVWEVKERGQAMGMFYLGPLCGPLLSPILGGAFSQALGWRSTMWFMAIFAFLLDIMILFCLPETLRERKRLVSEVDTAVAAEATAEEEKGSERPALTRTLTKQSVQIKTRKYWKIARRTLVDPLRIVLYLQFPAVAICIFYSAVTFASLYMLNISVQAAFSAPPYNFHSIIIGLLYLPNSVGYFISSVLGGRWVDWIMHREARKAGRYDEHGKLVFRPEDRMKENAWLGAFLYPASLITYGWTTRYKTNLAGPLVANFGYGLGSMLIFALATTMLTEFMPRKASNGVALNNFVRNIFSCILIAVTEPLIKSIGDGWLFTIVGLVCVVSGSITIWAMKRFGDHWRINMDKHMEEVMGE